MRPPRLGPDDLAAVERIMAPADEALARGYPGDPGTRQPVHTVYVPADRVGSGVVQQHGTDARADRPGQRVGVGGVLVEGGAGVCAVPLDHPGPDPVGGDVDLSLIHI